MRIYDSNCFQNNNHCLRYKCCTYSKCPMPVCLLCKSGPIGPQGPPGPPGSSSGVQAVLDNAANVLIEDSANLIFNTVLNQSANTITYNPDTGSFTLPPIQNFYLSWWIALNGTETSSTIDFTILLNGIKYVSSSLPVVTGQLTGSAFLTTGNGYTSLTLTNTTGEIIRLANTSTQANLVLLQLGEPCSAAASF